MRPPASFTTRAGASECPVRHICFAPTQLSASSPTRTSAPCLRRVVGLARRSKTSLAWTRCAAPRRRRLPARGEGRRSRHARGRSGETHRCQLLVLSLWPGQDPVADSRIVAFPYEEVARAVYDDRLRAVDALVMPFRPTGMLTTRTVGDAVAHGLPCIVSDWPFLAEVMPGATIPYGRTAKDLTACIDGLTTRALAAARSGAIALRRSCHRSRSHEPPPSCFGRRSPSNGRARAVHRGSRRAVPPDTSVSEV